MVHQADVCGAMCELSARARAFSVEALLGAKRARVSSSTSSQEDWISTNSEKNTLENVSFSSERFIPKTWAKNEMTYQPKPTSPITKLKHKLNVELCSRDLWKKFHALGTEMIITKAGRRMFPTVKVRMTGLDPSASYIVFLDIVAVDDKRYRYVYHSSQWMVAGSGDPSSSTNLYVHPDSPATGQLWMAQGVVAFDKLKLTNNKKPLVRGQVSLHSMHKYQPRVHIMPTTDLETQPEKQVNQQKALSFSFPETTFTTVTAYQNQQITRLKIASNPFAKGFREASRTRQYMDDTQNESSSSFIIPSIMGSTKLHSNELFGLDSQLELLSTPSVLQCGQSVTSIPEFFSSALPKCQPLTLPVKFVVPPPGCHTMLYNQDHFLQMSNTERQQHLSRNDPVPKTSFLKNMHVGMSVKCTETANSEISYFSNCIELSQHIPFSSSGNIDFLKEKYANNTVTKEQQEVLKANDTIKISEKNLSDDIFYSSYDTSIKNNQMYINIKGNPSKYGPIYNVYKDRTNEYSSLRSIFNVYGQTISKPLDLSKIK